MPYFFYRTAEWEPSIGLLRSVRYFRTRSLLMPPSVSLPLAITMRKKCFMQQSALTLTFCSSAWLPSPVRSHGLLWQRRCFLLHWLLQFSELLNQQQPHHPTHLVQYGMQLFPAIHWDDPCVKGSLCMKKITGSAHLRCPSYRNNALYMCASWSVHIFSFTVISYGLLTTEVCLM